MTLHIIENKKIETIGDIMGRIKTTMIKNIGERLYKDHKDEFTTDFEKNKE
jgi:SSU ribosomal protein S17E